MLSAGQNCIDSVSRNSKRPHRARQLMLAASVSALTLAAPQIIMTPAQAQALPSGCTDLPAMSTPNNGDGDFDAGETVTCVSTPNSIGAISTDAEDITIVVGSETIPTNVSTSGVGVSISGGGTVDIRNAYSTVYGEIHGVYLENSDSAATDLTLISEGAINSSDLNAVVAQNVGSADTSISVNTVTSESGGGIYAYMAPSAGDLTITATGAVSGETDGIDIKANALGAVDLTVVDVIGTRDNGINVNASNLGAAAPSINDIAITSTGTITGGRHGVFVEVYREDYPGTVLNLNHVSAGAGDGVHVNNGNEAAGVSITVSGGITAGNDGLYVRDYNGDGEDLTISVNNVFGADDGIELVLGAGGSTNTFVTSQGLIAGGDRGIEMLATSYGGTVTFGVRDITGGNVGVYSTSQVENFNFNSTGTVTGVGGDGIHLIRPTDTNLTLLNVKDVIADHDGIDVTHNSSTPTGNTDGVIINSGGTITALANGLLVANNGDSSANLTAYNITARGGDGINATNASTATNLTISGLTDGFIDARENGVVAYNNGTGVTTISVDDIDAGETGVYVYAAPTAGDVSVTARGAITAGGDGVIATNTGTGATTISAYNITATSGDGVKARNASTATDLTITGLTYGLISAGGDGVYASNDGTGATTISVDSVDADDTGVEVHTASSTTGDVSVTASGAITAGDDGVYVSNYGAGATTISANNITATSGDGVNARNASTATDLTITGLTGGLISAGGDGVYASNNGTGATTITAYNITATGGDGINATNGSTATNLTITGLTYGHISAAGDGIYALNNGTGATTISVNSIDAGVDGVEVSAASSTTGDVSVTARGTITAGDDGVNIFNNGTGATSVSVNNVYAYQEGLIVDAASTTTGDVFVSSSGTVRSTTREGVFVDNSGAGAVSVEVNNVYAQQQDAIGVENSSAGKSLSITTYGAVESESAIGISALNGGTDLLISVESGSVTGRSDGIVATNNGSGSMTLNLYGAVTGEIGHGLYLTHYGVNLSVTSTDSITGNGVGYHGAYISNGGTGATTVSVTDVNADYGAGIYALNRSTATNLTVAGLTGGLISAGGDGVRASNYGTGATTVSVHDVNAGGTGVYVYAGSSSGDVAIETSGTVSGSTGIYAENNGSGSLSITTADVTGSTGDAITVYNDGTDVTIDTSAGAVQGERTGVNVQNNAGVGDVLITTADVTGNTENGIAVLNGAESTTIDSSAGTVSGVFKGIFAAQSGDGDLTITSNNVIAIANDGVSVTNAGAGTSSISVNDVDAGDDGISLLMTSAATGDAFVTASGEINAGGRGLNIRNDGVGAIDVSVNNVEAEGDGLRILSTDASDVSITTTGVVTGGANGVYVGGAGSALLDLNGATAAGGNGVIVNLGSSAAGDVSVTSSGAIYGSFAGVQANNNGTGSTFVDVTEAAGGFANGILATTRGVDLFVTASGTVSGGLTGISATNNGTGVTVVDAADVVGENRTGISAVNNGAGLTVNASGTVQGSGFGISAINNGAGPSTINVVDVVSADSGAGIFTFVEGDDLEIVSTGHIDGYDFGIQATHNGSEGDVSISAVDVTGHQYDGVFVTASGDISITSTGGVQGGNIGIVAYQLTANDVTIDVADVSGDASGAIRVGSQNGGGDVSITTRGVVSSAGDSAINVRGSNTDVAISTSGGSVTSYLDAIKVENTGAGASIAIANAVTSETGYGVRTTTAGGADIVVGAGGSVTGALAAISLEGAAAPGDAIDDSLQLEEGGSISGDVLLRGGDDAFTDGSGQFTTIFGGDGTDTANFAAGAVRTINGSGTVGDSLQEFEVFNFNAGGFELAGAHTGLISTTFNTGTNTLTGSLTSAQVSIAEGATLNAADGSLITGLLNVGGTLSIGNSPGMTTVDGDVVFGANSVLPIEISDDGHDALIATGSVALDGELQVLLLGGLDVGSTTRTIINAGTGVTGAFSSVSGDNGLLITNTVGVDESSFDVSLTTTLRAASSVDGLNGNQANIGDSLIGLLGQSDLDPGLADYIISIAAISDAGELGSVLGELSPEGFDAGLRFLTHSQTRFMTEMTSRPGSSPGDGPYTWGTIDLSRFSKNNDARSQGFKGDVHEFSAGVSNIGRGWVRFGIAGGYATFNGETDAGLRDETDASVYRLAASAQILLDGAGPNGRIDNVVGFASGESDLSMRVIDPTTSGPVLQSGETDIQSLGFVSRFTMTGVNGREWKVRPHVELGLDKVSQDAALVGVGQPTSLSVEDVESVRGRIGLGASFDREVADGLTLRGSATGMRYFGETENTFRSRLAGAPDGTSGFETLGTSVEWQAQFSAGASYEHASGFTLSADAFGDAGDVNAYGARIELLRRF